VSIQDTTAYSGEVVYGISSWYGNDGVKYNEKTASGRHFNPNENGCASWVFEFGVQLQVTNIENGLSTICTVFDRGPALRLGRIIDLYKATFMEIADLDIGLITVSIEVIHA